MRIIAFLIGFVLGAPIANFFTESQEIGWLNWITGLAFGAAFSVLPLFSDRRKESPGKSRPHTPADASIVHSDQKSKLRTGAPIVAPITSIPAPARSKTLPKEIYEEITNKIIAAAVVYESGLTETDPTRTAYAGAEIVYFLLHLVDRTARQLFGPPRRDEVSDAIAGVTIADNVNRIFNESTPHVREEAWNKMIDDLYDRQCTYAQCKSPPDELFPSHGTPLFACGYFIHKALGRTDRTDVEDILIGLRDVTAADMDAFPDLQQQLELAIHISSITKKLNLRADLNKLKRHLPYPESAISEVMLN